MSWGSKLTEKLAVRDQPRALATLRDAAEYMQAYYVRVSARGSLTFKAAIQDLTDAAQSGRREDIEAATLKVRAFLSGQGLLLDAPRKSAKAAMDIQARLKAEIARRAKRKE
jgi:hypothetical protein